MQEKTGAALGTQPPYKPTSTTPVPLGGCWAGEQLEASRPSGLIVYLCCVFVIVSIFIWGTEDQEQSVCAPL